MTIWDKISLRTRIYLIVSALVLVTILGAFSTIWYTYRMQTLLTRVIDRHVAAFQVAEALETALVNQKGFVSYYFLDGNPDWLRQLGAYRQIFKERLNQAGAGVETERERKAIKQISSEYSLYITQKDRVIDYYRAGERQKGAKLHTEVRGHFFRTLELCEEYKKLHQEKIHEARGKSLGQAQRLRIASWTAIFTVLFLACLLIFILIASIFKPVRTMALEADRKGGSSGQARDEVKILGDRLRGLIEDVNHTHWELERSRESLLQSEKMALVGKLAAGTAHSIRNPLTSVKMRLFSLSRTLRLGPTQKEDFEVISDEIRHIDTIVQNFLEFSRPPKLQMQEVSPSEVVDATIQLLRHRLQSYNVEIRLHRDGRLPRIQADPEQLKEVLVNLVINACEAMEGGGLIEIQEKLKPQTPAGPALVIHLSDTGPGIAESIRDRILEPFFTTKEEGTGLGLSIAARIIGEHGGRLDLSSAQGKGTTFVITLPLKESHHEHRPDH